MHTKADIERLAEDFKSCRKVLTALGDENRQHMILEMMKSGNCSGVRVGEITERRRAPEGKGNHGNASGVRNCIKKGRFIYDKQRTKR